MEVCLHYSLVEGIVIAVCLHFTRVASGGNAGPGYPGSDNGGVAGVALPHEGIVSGSSCRVVVLHLPGAMRNSNLKMDQWLMEVSSESMRRSRRVCYTGRGLLFRQKGDSVMLPVNFS
jgi:hypothetical protein